MQKSPLQIARQSYQPKMPVALQGAVRLVEGEKTHSVADQEEIQKLFPNTYGMPVITMEPRRFRNSSRTRTVCRLSRWSPQQARTNVRNRLTSA